MQAILRLVALAGAVTLAACCSVPNMISLHALYEERDLVFEPSLLGTWEAESETIRIEKSGEKGYRVVAIGAEPDQEDREMLHFKLLRIGGIPFIDVSTTDKLGHQFGKLAVHGDRIELSVVDPDWLERKALEGELEHETVPYADCTAKVITASTRDLQFFLLKYATTPEAFEETVEIVRTKSPGEFKR